MATRSKRCDEVAQYKETATHAGRSNGVTYSRSRRCSDRATRTYTVDAARWSETYAFACATPTVNRCDAHPYPNTWLYPEVAI